MGRYYSVVKDPLKAATKWKDELSPADIERIRSVVAKTQPGGLYHDD